MTANGTASYRLRQLAALRDAWSYMDRRSVGNQRRSTGIDGLSINGFAQRADDHLRLLSVLLAKPSHYIFSPLKAHFERKPDGSDRVICVPTVHDRVVQRAALDLLASDARFSLANEFSYGFVKNRSVKDAVTRAKELRAEHPWAYKTDITAFFDTVDRAVLRDAIRIRVRWRSLHGLLFNAVDCEIRPRPEQVRRLRASNIKSGKGVRQGMPLSPYFANAVLWDFDMAARRAGHRMVRYADDLVFFGDSEADCIAVHEFCAVELGKIGLRIHAMGTKKTYIAHPSCPVGFLGVELAKTGDGYSVRISDVQMAGKKAELNQLSSVDGLLQNRVTISRLLALIDGKIAGWEGAYGYCDNFGQFRDKMRDWRSALLDKIFRVELGIEPLTVARKKFLELTPL